MLRQIGADLAALWRDIGKAARGKERGSAEEAQRVASIDQSVTSSHADPGPQQLSLASWSKRD
jgi:hypothetical protein